MKLVVITLTSLLIACLLSTSAFALNGYIQVNCEPGVKIYIDGAFKGTTNQDEGGLAVDNVRPGRHNLKAVKKGYAPFVSSIDVPDGNGVPITVNFKDLGESVEMLPSESGASVAEVGNFELQSIPMGATVFIDGQKKAVLTSTAKMKNIKAGRHTVLFERGGKKLSGSFALDADETLKLKADFKNKKIINISYLEIAEEEKQREEHRIEIEKERRINDEADEKAWQEAKAMDKPTNYHNYISDYPNGKHKREVEERLYIVEPLEIIGGNEYKHKKMNIKFVKIPAGPFLMGSDNNWAKENVRPPHKVYLDEYYISKCEITVSQYQKFCNETGRNLPQQPPGEIEVKTNLDNYPIVNVTWNDAKAFCDWANLRLPSEAEWEKASGGEDKWTNGFDARTVANFGGTGGPVNESIKDVWFDAAPVGSLRPNSYGIYDMIGNVWEWCSDFYAPDYYKNSPDNNPKGPPSGVHKVMRGGSFADFKIGPTTRQADDPNNRFGNVGFRCAW